MSEIVRVAERISASKKYRAVYSPTIERVVAICLKKYGESKAEEEARNVLHQMWGSYYPTRPDFKKLILKFEEELRAGRREEAISMILRLHASSAERLPFLTDFYKKIFSVILARTEGGPLQSIIDYGCCLDPVAFSLIRSAILELDPRTQNLGYQAFDIDTEEVAFLQKACAFLEYDEAVKVLAGDAISDAAVPADVVFMLKLLPVLEQQQKGSARDVLMKQRARWLVVSYPVASLSGKEKGMREFYTAQFYSLIEDTDWEVVELDFPTELVFVVDTNK